MLDGKVNDGRCFDLRNHFFDSHDVQRRPKNVGKKKLQTLKATKWRIKSWVGRAGHHLRYDGKWLKP